jgi:hypothetical protein
MARAGQNERWDPAPNVPPASPYQTPGDGSFVLGPMVPMPAVVSTPMPWFRIDGLRGGLAVAALAAIVATGVWYAVVAFSSYQIGFVAAAVGWVIGTGAVLGARGRGSLWLVAASVALTLVALTVGEYLIAYHYLSQEPELSFGLLQSPLLIIELVIEIIRFDPVTLLFWALALAAAAWVPFKAIGATEPGPTEPGPLADPATDSPEPAR